MLMLTELLSALAILVTLMAFTYSLHRDLCRRMDGLEQKFERWYSALDRKLDMKVDALHGRMDALVQPQIKLVSR
jgi:hypothetical protein